MLRSRRTGMIVWGAIIVFGGIMMATLLFSGTELSRSTGIIGIVMIIGGGLLLGFGIAGAVKASKHNSALIAEGKTYIGKCVSCGNPIKATIRDFRPHGRFPEGYMVCPVCKKPVSKNAFNVYDAYGNLIRPSMQSNYYGGYTAPQAQNQYQGQNYGQR